MIRDEEIKRLIHYAKGMGVNVIIYSKNNKMASADWSLDGTTIRVHAGPRKSKTEIVLDLIHEIGHHVWFIHEKNRQPDMKFEEAITRENFFEQNKESHTPKNLRKKIYDVELAGTEYWEIIYKDTDIKIPKWKMAVAKEFDMWMYEMYYENGIFPNRKVRYKRYLEIQSKHRPR